MPLTKPAFFQSDRRPRWRNALLSGWIWLRLRRRHNPGFLTAAAAGSIGLVLTLLLLFNGGFGLGGADKNAEPEVAMESDLGAPSDTPPEKSHAIAAVSPTDLVRDGVGVGGVTGKQTHSERGDDEMGILVGTRGGKPAIAAGRAIDKRARPAFDDEPLNSQEEPESNEPPAIVPEKAVATRAQPPKFEENPVEEKKEEEEPKSEDDRGFLPDDEPLTQHNDDKPAAEAVPARTKPAVGALPLLADDNATEEPADDSKDDAKLVEEEPQKSQPQATTVVRAEPQSEKAADEAPAGDDPFLQPKPQSSWKDSKAKPLPPVKEPVAGAATQSRAVETAVYATTPEPKDATPRPTQAQPPSGPAQLALEIRAPKNISPGQTFDLEFVVTNTSRQAVEGASLSVALPPGLVHPQGPDLEQPIVSLAGCQQYRGRMKVKAVGSGEVSPRADVSVRGRIGAQSTIMLRVGETSRQVRSGTFDPCACEPIRMVR